MDRFRLGRLSFVLLIITAPFPIALSTIATPLFADEKVDYLRDIKPLLEDHCTYCHGADKQHSDLRLDAGKLLLAGGINGPSLLPGKSEQSLLIQAITGQSKKVELMPPKEEDNPLSQMQITLLRRWVDQGATFPVDEELVDIATDHWSFQPLVRPSLPAVKNRAWMRTPLDAFVLSRLEKEGIAPSADASREVLIRRISLDLLGLSPTIEEVDKFVSDSRPNAYEHLVDRLLASPRYGERWGRHWLDQARYADSDGYTNDVPRVMWKYRDWVIDALNRDQPFDQFTIEQFAGDLLPGATTDQIIATGFHRNTQRNREGGSDPEQYRVESIVDRVNTTGVVYLGLTLGCARCHAHKFDPVSQSEYYELFAFLNSQDEPQLTIPLEDTPDPRLAALRKEIAAEEKSLKAYDASKAPQQAEWTKQLSKAQIAWQVLKPTALTSTNRQQLKQLDDNSILVSGPLPKNDTFIVAAETDSAKITAVRLELLTHDSLPGKGPGRASNGNFVLHDLKIFAAKKSGSGAGTPVVSIRALADHSQPNFPIAAAVDNDIKTGWAINYKNGKGNIHSNRTALFIFPKPIGEEGGSRLTFIFHQGDPTYFLGRFRLSVTAAPANLVDLPLTKELTDALATAPEQRSKAQKAILTAEFRRRDPQRGQLSAKIAKLKVREKKIASQTTTTTLVMKERAQPRESYVHIRGDFLRHGKTVVSHTPRSLPPMPKEIENPSRLDLARWLVSDENPLTPRVTVNRIWQRFFGVGIVETENDFGAQGSPPTHPLMLDHLAAELIHSDWSLKALQKKIVLSSVYRQSSNTRHDLKTIDPDNRLLARQNRVRLDAEVIRDTALVSSGLLSSKLKGPSVYPPQPDGVMKMTRNPNRKWIVSTGEDRYRRGMYTYFWRSTPHPFLKMFNAPESNTTCTRRDRSNTPLQALTLLNDEAFIETAQALAIRVLRDAPSADPQKKLDYAFRLCLARSPTAEESAALAELLTAELNDPSGAKDQQRFAPAAWMPKGLSAVELAAWTTIGRTLLNLDEFITRE